MKQAENQNRGGFRMGAGAKSKWKTPGKTKLVRIPEAITDQVLEAARAIDAGKRLILPAQRQKTPKPNSPSTAPNRSNLESVPKRTSPSGWIEKYTVRRHNHNKASYYRYNWVEGRKIYHCHIPGGNVDSKAAQFNLQQVKLAIAEGKSPLEIRQMIKSRNCFADPDQFQPVDPNGNCADLT